MTSKYTVVQYVPNPTADERMNFGVIAWDRERARSRFVTDWRRLRFFGGENIKFLREFAERIDDLTAAQLPLPNVFPEDTLDSERLQKFIGTWSHSIQFTQARGSLKNADALLDEAASTFLRPIAVRHTRGHDRRAAARDAYQGVFKVIHRRLPNKAQELVRQKEIVQGKYDKHKVDVALLNGRLYGAVQALSFEIHDSELLDREIDSTAWSIDDMRKRFRRMPIAVYVLRPRTNEGAQKYAGAKTMFREIGASVIENRGDMETWTEEKVRLPRAA